jgi:hypothetical protein
MMISLNLLRGTAIGPSLERVQSRQFMAILQIHDVFLFALEVDLDHQITCCQVHGIRSAF